MSSNVRDRLKFAKITRKHLLCWTNVKKMGIENLIIVALSVKHIISQSLWRLADSSWRTRSTHSCRCSLLNGVVSQFRAGSWFRSFTARLCAALCIHHGSLTTGLICCKFLLNHSLGWLQDDLVPTMGSHFITLTLIWGRQRVLSPSLKQ